MSAQKWNRALILDENDELIATAWREGYLKPFPERKDQIDSSDFLSGLIAIAQLKEARLFGWLSIGMSLPVPCACILSWIWTGRRARQAAEISE
jgi:hypothetical protein